MRQCLFLCDSEPSLLSLACEVYQSYNYFFHCKSLRLLLGPYAEFPGFMIKSPAGIHKMDQQILKIGSNRKLFTLTRLYLAHLFLNHFVNAATNHLNMSKQKGTDM